MLVRRIGKHDLPVPAKATSGAAAFDLQAQLQDSGGIAIMPGERAVVQTGFAWQIYAGFAGLVCSRSGNAARFGVFVLNAPGIIDPDYTGEVKVILHNAGSEPFSIEHGDRIAQMLITPAIGGCCVTETGDEFAVTARGDGGLGSTGK